MDGLRRRASCPNALMRESKEDVCETVQLRVHARVLMLGSLQLLSVRMFGRRARGRVFTSYRAFAFAKRGKPPTSSLVWTYTGSCTGLLALRSEM